MGARKSTTARVERMDRHQRRQAALKANGGVTHVDPNDAHEAAMAGARAAAVAANNDAIAAAARIAAPADAALDELLEDVHQPDSDDDLDDLIDEANSSAAEH